MDDQFIDYTQSKDQNNETENNYLTNISEQYIILEEKPVEAIPFPLKLLSFNETSQTENAQITEEKFTQLYDEHLKWLEALLNPNKKVFRGRMNLSGADLSGRNLDGLNLSGGSSVGASLVGTNFTGADLSGADLSDVRFSNTKFKRAVLNRAVFTNDNKEGIDITLASTIGTVWNKKEEGLEDNNDSDTDVDIIDISTKKHDVETIDINMEEEG